MQDIIYLHSEHIWAAASGVLLAIIIAFYIALTIEGVRAATFDD